MDLEKLVKRARFIDKMDAFTGPFAALCFQSGNEFLASVGFAVSVAELLVKIPFSVSYTRATQDYKALAFWGVKEVVINLNPEMSYMDVLPSYSLRAGYMLRRLEDW
ncbi:MAG: hypothetical protein KC535_01375 [Nanoarchaeota archaeon]|nr:hypothetical protein [Nanoarchaeota archaeon]